MGCTATTGICLLCNRECALQQSHIIPAFVFKWLKKDGHIRHAENINRRVQDGAKVELLCRECEAKFNVWETTFSNNLFQPFCYGGALPRFSYGDWLLRFCTSVSWRSLAYIRRSARLDHFSPSQVLKANDAAATWASFLRGDREHPGVFEQHLIPFGPITRNIGIDFPPNINRYLLRNVEIDAGRSQSTAFVFSKLGRIGILGFIDLRNPEHWVGSKVRLRGGRIIPRSYKLPVQFGGYLADRAKRAWASMERMSDQQQEKVDTAIRANFDKFANSQVLEAMQYDVRLFGNAAFRRR
jgi:hypothetical protein